jgi:hypothetical protein
MTEIKTGSDILRACALRRVKRAQYAALAQELRISADRFRKFAEGQITLPVETLQAMTREFFPHSRYNLEHDALEPANTTPPRSIGIVPEPYVRTEVARAVAQFPAFTCETEPAKKKKRAGWLGSWLYEAAAIVPTP